MDFFEAVQKRRSIRQFTNESVPEEVVRKALEAAVLAPNSSNVQSWNFYWIKTPEMKKKIVEGCLSQAAARTAQHLVVVTADPHLWKRSHKPLINWVESVNAPKPVLLYYRKIIPMTYRTGFLNFFAPFKFLLTFVIGLFRPITRGPITRGDLVEVAIKSAALAAENFVLAVTSQGYSTCMMEGFDACRISSALKLKWGERTAMVIGIGRESERGTWGPRFRLNLSDVVKEV